MRIAIGVLFLLFGCLGASAIVLLGGITNAFLGILLGIACGAIGGTVAGWCFWGER